MSWDSTARLLRRTGFGTSGAAVDQASRIAPADLVARMLAVAPDDDPGARRTPVPQPAVIAPPGQQRSQDERRQFRRQLQQEFKSVVAWWIRRMAAVDEPFGEKLTFLWHDHFATAIKKVRQPALMVRQNITLRTKGRGDFRDLALAMLVDPAMLRWLDGQLNTAAAPNENLAREFMELFALGHGDGYTETDVREGARALTGWKIDRQTGTAQLRPRLHDNGKKTVLGVTGNLDYIGFCDAVLARPASAGFVTARLWSRLVSADPPSSEALGALTDAYGPKRDLSALLQAMLTRPEMTTKAGTLVTMPVEWMVGLLRSLKVPLDDDKRMALIQGALLRLGQLPMLPPNVSGWPSGQAWLTTSAAELRMRIATTLAAAGDLDAVSKGATSTRVEAVGHIIGVGAWSPRSAAVLKDAAAQPNRLVAFALNTPEYLTT
jgi:uncharacterized protein (DUF1800 family)